MEGDVIARMRLDVSDVDTALRRVERMMKKTAAAFRPITSKVSRDMKTALDRAVLKHKVAAAEIALAHKKAALKVSRNWWDSFGKVALGFTVAYRAMNAFEAGLRKFGEILLGAIQESGELAAFQAKQALWFKMYSKDVITYADAYKRAAVNAKALADASIYSMATLEELTTGFDELGQAGIIAGKKSTKMFADLVSFTTLIAQTVGSTTRQIRQEFQALAEGQVRTTNILIRTMLRMGVISKEDVSNLKRMVDTEKIILKIVTKISAEWSEVEKHIISADPLTAMRFWEKHVKAIWRQTITLASALEDVDNIFADVFVKHAKKLRESLEKEPETGLVLFVLALRDALDLALISFTKFINFVAFSAVAIKNLSDELVFVSKVIGAVLAVKLGEFFVKLSLGMTKFLLTPLKSITARILALPALFVATAIAIESLSPKLELTDKDIKTFGKTTVSTLDWILEKLRVSRKAWEDYLYGPGGEPSYKEPWQKFKEAYKKNAKRHLGELKEALTPMLTEIDKMFADLGTPKDPKTMKEEVDAMVEGLTSLLDDVVKTDDKILKERLKLSQRFRDDIQKLTLDEADFKMYKMQQVLDRAEALGMDEVLIAEWSTAQINAIYDKATKERIAEADKDVKAFLQREQRLLTLVKQMQKDFLVGRIAQVLANIEKEYQIRLTKIEKLAIAEERARLRAMALAARTAKYEQTLRETLKHHTKAYYEWKKTEIEKDAEAMIAAGSKAVDVDKWKYDKLKALTIEYNQHTLEHTDSLIEGTAAAWENWVLKSKSWIQEVAETSLELMQTFAQGVGDAFARTLIYGENLVASLQSLAQTIAATIISTLIRIGVQAAITKAMVAMIGSPMGVPVPSFDNGGISTVPGLYYAGVPEAHIPLKSGKVPVEIKDEKSAVQVDIVNVFDPVMFDQYLASSRGRDAIVNVIGVKSQSVRRVLR